MGSAESAPSKDETELSEPEPETALIAQTAALDSANDESSEEPNRTNSASFMPIKSLLRESSTLPLSIGRLLDGGTGDHNWDDETEEEAKERKVPGAACIRRIYVGLFAIVCCTLILVTLSVWLELIAYFADQKWNQVLVGKATFPRMSGGGNDYFGGKKLVEAQAIFPSSHMPHIQRKLMRGQELEGTFLWIVFVFLIAAIVHLIAFSTLPKFRKLFDVMYIGYGIMGVLLFLGGIFLTMSTLVTIPSGFIGIRIYLEDEVGVEATSNHSHDPVSEPDICDIHTNVTVLNVAELRQLLSVVKMCAYRYVQINSRDPCRHVPIPSHVEIMMRNFSVNDFQDLGICPMDNYKIRAMVLTFAAAVCCWIITSIGSYIEQILKLSNRNIRKTLQLDHHPQKRSSSEKEVMKNSSSPNIEGLSKSVQQGHQTGRDSGESAYPWFLFDPTIHSPATTTLTSTTAQEIVAKVENGTGGHPTSQNHSNRYSVMTITPNLVIHPTSVGDSRQRNTTWFYVDT